MPVQPASTIHSAWRARNAWSTSPSAVKGVVMAGITPFQVRVMVSSPRGMVNRGIASKVASGAGPSGGRTGRRGQCITDASVS